MAYIFLLFLFKQGDNVFIFKIFIVNSNLKFKIKKRKKCFFFPVSSKIKLIIPISLYVYFCDVLKIFLCYETLKSLWNDKKNFYLVLKNLNYFHTG